MWSKLITKAQTLVTRHGTEVGMIAKIATHGLIPGAPLLVSAVESLCDYSADSYNQKSDREIKTLLNNLGGDVEKLDYILGQLGGS